MIRWQRGLATATILVTALLPAPLAAGRTVGRLQSELQPIVAAQSAAIAVYVLRPNAGAPVASGMADRESRRAMTVDTPLRIASNTKTFVAATVLRLWEQGRINLDAPISALLTPALDRTLTRDGYDTGAMTVRHLLSHSAGLYDHGSDPRFVELLKVNRSRRFTRAELVQLCADYADPQSMPGTEFRYSDTGYILLGDIVERRTGKSLARAVRDELGLDRLGMKSTWWEVHEPPRRGAAPRARQFLGELEVTDVDPSLDLYGGGGLLSSARDMATFFATLFGGKVFARPATLREMLWKGPHRGADGYRLGIFVRHAPAGDIYWHSGFWGTYAAWAPSTRTAVGAVAVRQGALKAVMSDIDAALFAPHTTSHR